MMVARVVLWRHQDALTFSATATNCFQANPIIRLLIKQFGNFNLGLCSDLVDADDINERLITGCQKGFGLISIRGAVRNLQLVSFRDDIKATLATGFGE